MFKLFFFVFIFPSLVLAGGGISISGGGHGVALNGEIQLLDLAEQGSVQKVPNPPTRFHFQVSIAHQLRQSALDLLIDSSNLALWIAELAEVDPILASSVFKTIRLYGWALTDLPLVFLPVETVVKQKDIVQLAARNGRNIYIHNEYWLKLSETHRSALIIHEALASLAEACSSLRVRQIVGQLFSGHLRQRPKAEALDVIGLCLPTELSVKHALLLDYLQYDDRIFYEINATVPTLRYLQSSELLSQELQEVPNQTEADFKNFYFMPAAILTGSPPQHTRFARLLYLDADVNWALNVCNENPGFPHAPYSYKFVFHHVTVGFTQDSELDLQPYVHWNVSSVTHSAGQLNLLPGRQSCWDETSSEAVHFLNQQFFTKVKLSAK